MRHQQQSIWPYILLALYLTVLLITVSMANRLTLIGPLLEPGGIVVFPLSFILLDIVGEVYGYRYSRLFIWIGVICQFTFAIMTFFVAHLPAPAVFERVEAYKAVFIPAMRFSLASLLGILSGEMLNLYLFTKLKWHCTRMHFMLRTLIATALGQAVVSTVVYLSNFAGRLPRGQILWMISSGLIWKVTYCVLFLFPSWVLVQYLIKHEKLQRYDLVEDFQPFKMTLRARLAKQQA